MLVRHIVFGAVMALTSAMSQPAAVHAQGSSSPLIPPASVPRSELSLSSGYAGFVDRCSRGSVACLEPARGDQPTERFSSLIARVGNVLRRCDGSDCRLYMRAVGRGWCTPLLMVDASPTNGSPSGAHHNVGFRVRQS